VLWVTGPARLDAVAERAAAIVGTRAATAVTDASGQDGARADLSHVTKAGTQSDTTERRLACFPRRR